MLEFLLFVFFFLQVIILFLCISILRTVDSNTDLLLDIDKNQRRLEKQEVKKGRKK